MEPKNTYNKNELLSMANGDMFGQENAKLPLEPMLMIDRILNIENAGGKYGKGSINAELDITDESWFFHCHFKGDPVMPGCLGLDGMWQLVGFFLVKHLLINWMEGEKYFKNCLLDYSEANNISGWQWVAGCGADAAPYFRIFNPILQGEKFDKEGE